MKLAYHAPALVTDALRAATHSTMARVLAMARSLLSVALLPVTEAYRACMWAFWVLSSLTLVSGHSIIVAITIARIVIDLALYAGLVMLRKARGIYYGCLSILSIIPIKLLLIQSNYNRIRLLYHQLSSAASLRHYLRLARELDRLERKDQWKLVRESRDYDYLMLEHQVNSLVRCRADFDVRGLMFTLQNIFSRHFCHINNPALYQHSLVGTKFLIEEFYSRVIEQLSFICQSNFASHGLSMSLRAKLRFFQRARKSYGRCALCLSGGGALAMYHAGVVRAMLHGNCLPSVIAGTSGGAIVAGLLASRTDSEMLEPNFLDGEIALRYGRWLPPLKSQIKNFFTKGILLDSVEFIHTARMFYADLTFEEAYKRTGRDVSITVSHASKESGYTNSHALVLNHITSPHVLIWSAVTSSCSLPGLMEPQPLKAKDHDGRVTNYYPHGTEWCDGSLQQDLPLQRLTELFNVQYFIVSQVNPHVSPFLVNASHTSTVSPLLSPSLDPRPSLSLSLLSRLEQLIQSDLNYRLQRLARLRIIPRIYGQDFTGMINGQQRYTGDITIFPMVDSKMVLKALTQPSANDMKHYLMGGERATYRHITQIQHSIIIERTLDECVRVCSQQLRLESQHSQQHLFAATTASITTTNVTGSGSPTLKRHGNSSHSLINADGSVNMRAPLSASAAISGEASTSASSLQSSPAVSPLIEDSMASDLDFDLDDMDTLFTPITSPHKSTRSFSHAPTPPVVSSAGAKDRRRGSRSRLQSRIENHSSERGTHALSRVRSVAVSIQQEPEA